MATVMAEPLLHHHPPPPKRKKGCCGLWSCLRHRGLLTYWVFHVTYFVVICTFGTLLIFAIEFKTMAFIDALFMSFSSATLGGLATVDVSQLHFSTQVIMVVLMQLGGAVLSTMPTLAVRRYFLRRATEEMAEETSLVSHEDGEMVRSKSINTTNPLQAYWRKNTAVDKNLEYQAVSWLFWAVGAYLVFWQSFSILTIGAYLSTGGREELLKYGNNQSCNPWFFAIFATISAWGNVGLLPIPTALVGFQKHPTVLVPLMMMIVLGNTAFPFVLWWTVWLYSKLPFDCIKKQKRVCKFLLTKSRTIYTHLFPATYTHILAVIFFLMFLGEATIFLISERDNPSLKHLNGGQYFLQAMFQSAATRTAGMNSVDIGSLAPGLLVVMTLSMYVVAYPLVFAIRRSDTSKRNRKRQALKQKARDEGLEAPAIFDPKQDHEIVNTTKADAEFRPRPDVSDLKQLALEEQTLEQMQQQLEEEEEQMRRMGIKLKKGKKPSLTERLAKLYGEVLILRDITWVYLAIMICCFAEGRVLSDTVPDNNTSVFKVVFEVVSAFGTVGFSMGYPGVNYSYAGVMTNTSKIMIIFIMMLGRHRGLPSSDDPAVVPKNYASLRAYRARRRELRIKMEQQMKKDAETHTGTEAEKELKGSGEEGEREEGEGEGEGERAKTERGEREGEREADGQVSPEMDQHESVMLQQKGGDLPLGVPGTHLFARSFPPAKPSQKPY